jgi:hypothetical protein
MTAEYCAPRSRFDAFGDVHERFLSREAWQEYTAANQWINDRGRIERIVAAARADGATISGTNYRETLVLDELNSRQRAMLSEIRGGRSSRILLLEAVTPFALRLRGAYPFALCAEYLPTEQDRAHFFPVPHCDICAADFGDGLFDLVVSNDVLEHVPDLDRALYESRRILKPGGLCLATFPFAYYKHETIAKARVEGGQVVHLTEPEYHGNPVDPKGSLVFAVPGWDVLNRCHAVGFSHAEIVFVSSVQRAITGTEVAGVFILRAQA